MSTGLGVCQSDVIPEAFARTSHDNHEVRMQFVIPRISRPFGVRMDRRREMNAIVLG